LLNHFINNQERFFFREESIWLLVWCGVVVSLLYQQKDIQHIKKNIVILQIS